MMNSAWHPDVNASFIEARAPGKPPFPSPQDWRDQWIYFLLVDRFNNPNVPPRTQPWDAAHNTFQGGTFNGVVAQLDYLKSLGVGALWLSPVLKNCQYDSHTYHGYGIQNFVGVEPRFASDPVAARRDPRMAESELRNLVDEAHKRGLYVIFDIVLNHAGDVFAYTMPSGDADEVPWSDTGPYPIRWHDADGTPRADWTSAPNDPPADAAVWPVELRRNEYFRRQGNAFTRPGNLSEDAGDFYSLKEFVTDFQIPSATYGAYYPVRDALIRSYQYIVAKFDVDGFRIDTLKYIEPSFSLTFGNAMREFALSIGKKNFFTFGEVYDDEVKIAQFIGRNTLDNGDMIGVDAALDFPLFFQLPGVAKGQRPPSDVIEMYESRRAIQRTQISSHGDASQYFVTFLDNHDQNSRFRYADPNDPTRYDAQTTLGLGCLFTLQGVPSVYYGTEQSLHGAGDGPEAVREALWGKPNAFDGHQSFVQAIQQLSMAREQHPALRYGRQYFRPISGNGTDFGVSRSAPGVLAFSRILSDQEVVMVANTDTQNAFVGDVILDYALNPLGTSYTLGYSNLGSAAPPEAIRDKLADSVRIEAFDGSISTGPTRVIAVNLQPMEFQIWAKA